MLKKIVSYSFIIGLFVLCLTNIGKAQGADTTKSRWYITTGFGYYNPPTQGTGNIFYSEIGYQLSTGYNVGIGFGLSDIFTEYDKTSPLLEGRRAYVNYYLIRLFINRSFRFGANDNHQIKLGSGIVRAQPRFSRPIVKLRPVYDDQGNLINKELIIRQEKSTSNSTEVGFPFVFEYNYSFGTLNIGFRAESHLLYDVGFESFIISPQIGFDF